MIGYHAINQVTATMVVPNMVKLVNKSFAALKNLRLSKVYWYRSYTLGITLTDGQSLKAGTEYPANTSHTFAPAKKITRREGEAEEEEE